MNRQIIYCTLLCFFLFGLATKANDQPEEISTSIKAIFIPVGFDNNDFVQIAISGVLTDSCYKVGPTKFAIDENNDTISIKQIIYDYTKSSKLCMKLATPFTQIVDLGILPNAKKYTIVTSKGGVKTTLGVLPIETAPSREKIDEELYLPTSQAYLKEKNPGKFELVLKGSYDPKCMALNKPELKTFPSNKVLIVLPTWKMVDGKPCASSESDLRPFTIEREIDSLLIGTYLIHIRTFQGKAINIFQSFTRNENPRW